VQVGRYGLVMRMVAEARQVPFMDLTPRLRGLPDDGLISDGLHMNRDPRSGCRFDDDGLQFGFNQRNLLTLQALDHVTRAVVFREDSREASALPAVVGSGAAADPFVVDVLPFTHSGDTSTSVFRDRDSYACAPAANESGPELSYTVTLTSPQTLHALVFDQGNVDVDVHVLRGDTCLARNDKETTVALDAGTYTVVFDTFGGDDRAGAFQTVLYAE
jgi:hypothetical protein